MKSNMDMLMRYDLSYSRSCSVLLESRAWARALVALALMKFHWRLRRKKENSQADIMFWVVMWVHAANTTTALKKYRYLNNILKQLFFFSVP